jgi:L,D-transpeptidase ErfK/SrfK
MKRRSVTTCLIWAIFITFLPPRHCLAALYQRNGEVIGQTGAYLVHNEESLYEIARSYDIGINAIIAANPKVDPFIPPPRSQVFLPTEWILPDVPIKRGILINIAEMRLYYFPSDNAREVVTFPIGIGDQGKDTPLGTFSIVEKIKNPPWYVPKSIQEEKPELPPVVPPGPDNPMGSYALRLSNQTVLIHGTNRPWGIGTRSSHGCIRLYEEDIGQLFDMIPSGTRVTIVNQPVKAAALGDAVLLEIHDYEDGRDLFVESLKILVTKNLIEKVDLEKVKRATLECSGLVVKVSR